MAHDRAAFNDIKSGPVDSSSWMFIAEGEAVPQTFPLASRVEIEHAGVAGFFEAEPVRPGLFLYSVAAHSAGGFRLAGEEGIPLGSVYIGCVTAGQGTLATPMNAEPRTWRDAGTVMVVAPPDERLAYELSIGERFGATGLSIAPEVLDQLASDDMLPSRLRASAGGRPSAFSDLRRGRGGPERIARELARPTYTGRMHGLFRESKVLEFLAHLLDTLDDTPHSPATELSDRERRRIEEARERLLVDLRNPPGLHDLADAVGLTARKLNRGFREHYGATVFEYLRDVRLDAARRMLDQGLELPLKQIAWQVGYGQANNFISAYRRRFGVPPRLHKRLLDERD